MFFSEKDETSRGGCAPYSLQNKYHIGLAFGYTGWGQIMPKSTIYLLDRKITNLSCRAGQRDNFTCLCVPW